MSQLADPQLLLIPRPLATGEIVGSYRIERTLGQGGMCVVYAATHTYLPRRAAVKVLHAKLTQEPRARDALKREACLLATVEHEESARVYDAGILEDGRPWMAMELIEGESLGDLISVRGALPLDQVAHYICGIATALSAAHTRGLIHGDIKPDNVMIDDAGEVRVVDWGTARTIGEAPELSAEVVGTPQYMAPEQVRCLPLDGRADIYALGIVAYELLTAQCPFSAGTPLDTARLHLDAQAPSIRQLRADVPELIDLVVLSMLAKSPSERPSLESVRASFQFAALTARKEREEAYDVDITLEIDYTAEPEPGDGQERTFCPSRSIAERSTMRFRDAALIRVPRES